MYIGVPPFFPDPVMTRNPPSSLFPPASLFRLSAPGRGAIPIVAVTPKGFAVWLKREPERVRRWVRDMAFRGETGAVLALPGADGGLARVVACLPERPEPWDFAALPDKLPAARYCLEPEPDATTATAAALGWALAGYRFARYRKTSGKAPASAVLAWPRAADRAHVTRTVEATFLVRDLINTPANDLGPAQLAAAARAVAARHGVAASVIAGARLARDYPAVLAVGRAASRDRAPRLIDFTWGRPNAPKVTLVGKGVCFDTGGLDLKPSSSMKLMKKDMGGAAHALGLAHMIMAAKLDVRLRVLIPAVENSVSSEAMRPLDVLRTRHGLTIEIGNTDAEGRVIMADALAEAARESPRLILDFATLTGAARVALGTELPALFCNDEKLAGDLLAAGEKTGDPLWRLPLWSGYAKQVHGRTADLTNAPEGGYAGAITAALFLERFVEAKPPIPWAHLDLMAWNTRSRPGRPEGGEAMSLRALFALLGDRFKTESSRGPMRKR